MLNTYSTNFAQCLDACNKTTDGSACRAVARVIGANDKDTSDLTRRQGYTLAHASGCTNRGANLCNSISDIGPYSLTDAPTLEACHTRMFGRRCMGLCHGGQAHWIGEDGPKDIGTAIKG